MLAITYCSITTLEFEPESIDILVERAAFNNKKVGITGYLYYAKGNFVQYIEGSDPDVTALMRKIEADERHRITNIVYDRDLEQRRFKDWSMRQLLKHHITEINLESIWKDLLNWNREGCYQWAEKRVWNIVEKISNYYKKTSEL